jgi:hypothetical protein
MTDAAFYCVADERYFLGAVAMINSLRLHGHTEPIFLLDRGLRGDQRDLLGREVRFVEGPAEAPPWLQKTIAPLLHPADVIVLIDSDMIVTRPLGRLIDRARGGRLVAFRNDRDRFVPEWGELLDLGTARRGPYISSGLVFMDGGLGEQVLRLLEDRQARVDLDLTFARQNAAGYAFLYPEQDVLNAIIATRLDPDQVDALGNELAPNPPYRGLRLTDEARLRCSHQDGSEPYVLHQFVRKPWLEPMYHGIYSRLFARLLLATDLAIRIPEEHVPLRMRSGIRARAERLVVNVVDLGRWYLGERLPAWGRRRLGSRDGRAAHRP